MSNRVTATLAEKMKIADLLRERLEIVGAKQVRYKPGHTDQSVAALVSPRLNEGHVKYVRLELFGNLVFIGPTSDSRVDLQMIKRMGEAINDLRMQLGFPAIDFYAGVANDGA